MQNLWSFDLYCLTFREAFIKGGSYGCVFKAHRIENSQQFFAIKKIPYDQSEAIKKLKEVDILIDLQSDFVVEYLNHWNIQNYYIENIYTHKNIKEIGSGNSLRNPHCDYILHIQMQYCVMSLREAIEKFEQQIELQIGDSKRLSLIGYFMASQLFIQLVKGVNFLHKKLIMHLDLKPENILISFDYNSHLVKIADFGNAMKENDRLPTSHYGTVGYMAPEASDGIYCIESDLYSLGKIAQHLFYINPKDTSGFYGEIYNVVNLIQKLKSFNKEDRGSCDEILESLENSLLTVNPTATTLQELLMQ